MEAAAVAVREVLDALGSVPQMFGDHTWQGLPADQALMMIAALVSCDAEPPVPSPSPSHSRVEAVHLAVECLVKKGAIGSEDLQNATWFKSGKVVPNTDFNDWYSTHEQTVYAGRTLVEWTSEAQAAGSAWRCPA